MAEFNHYTPIQIRFADLDALNHVNNANYMTYMETARMAYCEDVLSDDLDWTTVGDDPGPSNRGFQETDPSER